MVFMGRQWFFPLSVFPARHLRWVGLRGVWMQLSLPQAAMCCPRACPVVQAHVHNRMPCAMEWKLRKILKFQKGDFLNQFDFCFKFIIRGLPSPFGHAWALNRLPNAFRDAGPCREWPYPWPGSQFAFESTVCVLVIHNIEGFWAPALTMRSATHSGTGTLTALKSRSLL